MINPDYTQIPRQGVLSTMAWLQQSEPWGTLKTFYRSPDSQCMILSANLRLSLPVAFMPNGLFVFASICAVSIPASPVITTRPFPIVSATACARPEAEWDCPYATITRESESDFSIFG